MKKYSLALLGSGYLNRFVAQAWVDGHLPQFELTGVLGQNYDKVKAFAKEFGCKACKTIDELLEIKPDFVGEAASVEGLKNYGEKILQGGSNLVVLSIGAFADTEFYQSIQKTAMDNGKRVYIASGAIGGLDVLRTISLMGPVTASVHSEKNPMSLVGTSLFKEDLKDITASKNVFDGTAKEAIEALPTHVNIAIAAALAGDGPEETRVKIDVTPGFVGDEHTVKIVGEGVKADMVIYSATSEIAAWSVVATLQNAVNPIVF